MPLWARWRAKTRALLGRGALTREVDREFDAWVDEMAARYQARGLSPDEARRLALAETGGRAQLRDAVWEARPRWAVDRALDRLSFEGLTALRALAATPLASLGAMLTLAASVGVNLAVFGLIDRALLSPPAHVAAPDRLFTLEFHARETATSGLRIAVPYPLFKTIRDSVPAFSRVAAFERTSGSATIDGDQLNVTAMLVSDGYFGTLGVQPALGHGLLEGTDRTAAASPPVVLSEAFWRRAFRADPAVLSRHLTLRGVDLTVTGVMPAGFSGHSADEVDLWVPFAAALRGSPDWERNPFVNLASVIGRLAPGAQREAAQAQTTLATGETTSLAPIIGGTVGATERLIAWWLAGVSVLVLLIGLANTSTLLVVRAAARRHDLAVRVSLGATRQRLISGAILEALLLSSAAIGLSLVAASWMDEAVRHVLFPDLIGRSGWGRMSLAVALLAGGPTALLTALANSWQVRVAAADRLGAPHREAGRRATSALLIVQVGISVFLVAGAATFGESLYRLAAQDFGMRMDGVVVVETEPGPDLLNLDALFRAALGPVRSLPGVDAATVFSGLPFGPHNVPPISVPGHAEVPNVGGQLPFLNAATPDYLRILGIQIVQGRTFTPNDEKGPPVVIVNEAMARTVWPGTSAVGHCIRIGFDDDWDPLTAVGPPVPSANVPCRLVVGVARDVRQRSVLPTDNEANLLQYFVPFAQVPKPPFAAGGPTIAGLLLHSRLAAETIAPTIRRIVTAGRTDLPFIRVMPFTDLLDRQIRPWRLGTTLLSLFALVALAVAAVGLYAAFAHAVLERRREMAVRLAIGADPRQVTWLVLRHALTLAVMGAAGGCLGASVASRAVQSLLFEATPWDPWVLGSSVALMLAVTLAATWLPARAASQADPSLLLRVS
jgi:putative ABC transport system permease protein